MPPIPLRLPALHGAAHKNFGASIQLLVDNSADLKAVSLGNPKTPKGVGLSIPYWAEGVPIGPQSSIFHPDAVAVLEKISKEKNIELVSLTRTKGGNAIAK
jgi:hypothetical protein